MDHSHTGFWIAFALLVVVILILWIWNPGKNKTEVLRLSSGSTVMLSNFWELPDGSYEVLFDSLKTMPNMITVLHQNAPGAHAQTYCFHASDIPGGKAALGDTFFLEKGKLQ